MPSDAERFARLRLARSERIGPVTFAQLMLRFGSAARALAALPDLAARGGGATAPTIASEEQVAREIERVRALGAAHLFVAEPGYPALLAAVDAPPPVLIARGNIALLDRPAVAMVGARNASAAACRFARQLAHEMAGEGFSVVSGLARGIDTAVHVGAAKSTVAVIAGGIDVIYPPENAALQEEIAEKALLLTEMPPGVEPRGRHFPRRNRIIAGLALGTVVVEAAPRSGSLITARNAAEAGREVMAVPGSPLDPRHTGCNQLIRDGATLIQSAADVIEAISPMLSGPHVNGGTLPGRPRPALQPALAFEEASHAERIRLTELLGFDFVATDELIRQSGLSSATVQMLLLELELAGQLERGAGGRLRLSNG